MYPFRSYIWNWTCNSMWISTEDYLAVYLHQGILWWSAGRLDRYGCFEEQFYCNPEETVQLKGGAAGLKLAFTVSTTWAEHGACLSPIGNTSDWSQRSLKLFLILLRYLQCFYSCPERNSLRACCNTLPEAELFQLLIIWNNSKSACLKVWSYF